MAEDRTTGDNSERIDDVVDHERFDVGEVTLHAVTAGPAGGPPVVCLHGFPEFWYGWRHQVPALADAGFRVVAPDQRGYNRSDRPDGLDAYTLDPLSGDVVGLLDALGYGDAHLVGHDWGAAVAWHTALHHPDRVRRLVPMNVPHPAAYEAALPWNPRQLLRSWYVLSFQFPGASERAWSAADWRLLRWFVDTSTREGTWAEPVLDRYREAWSRPGAFSAMLDWYRALVRREPAKPPSWTVEVPTLVLWGVADPYIVPELADASVEYCADGRLERVESATHWLHHEVPRRVNDCLVEFLPG
ncbi:MAG: alpha/beta hydrolase [Haloarculaceae archaeon]